MSIRRKVLAIRSGRLIKGDTVMQRRTFALIFLCYFVHSVIRWAIAPGPRKSKGAEPR